MSHARNIQRLRGISNPETRKLVKTAMNSGLRYRMTKSGIVFYGDNGQTAGMHFTSSDHRAYKNLVADLRNVGYQPKGTS
jgi:hypothetical protein